MKKASGSVQTPKLQQSPACPAALLERPERKQRAPYHVGQVWDKHLHMDSFGAKLEQRDLGRGKDPHRGSPKTRPAADVQLGVAASHQPREVRLLQSDRVTPREDLPAVGVTAELQVDALLRRFEDLTRLVSQEHHRASPIAPVERPREIATVIPSKRVPIVHASQVEASAVVTVDGDPLVAQHAKS